MSRVVYLCTTIKTFLIKILSLKESTLIQQGFIKLIKNDSKIFILNKCFLLIKKSWKKVNLCVCVCVYMYMYVCMYMCCKTAFFLP